MENRSLVIQVKSETEVTSYDYIDVVREIELTTNRMDAPGKLVFSCVEQGPVSYTHLVRNSFKRALITEDVFSSIIITSIFIL